MKVVGIIAEYNPFHKGHEYQIKKLREETGADYVIAAMSGNFLQRGAPALCDKQARTQMALSCGADLVLEIPTLWATASAEYFAQGGVELLKQTGVVTHLGFGAESSDLEELLQVASVLKEEPDIYRGVLSNSIRSGNPFPVARKNALVTTLPLYSEERLNALLDAPNNILALEYLKALPSTIAPVLIPRKGAGYHDKDIQKEFPSASAIREAIYNESDWDDVTSAMPEEAFRVLHPLLVSNSILEANDFSEMLAYSLLYGEHTGFASYADCNQDFSNKIKKHLNDFATFEELIQKLKTKDMTYTRVSRSLLHILLNIRQVDYSIGKAIGYVPYLRVLGFREDSKELLSSIKKNSDIPIITKVADASTLLGYESYKIFEKDLFASSLYYKTLAHKSNTKPQNEFTNQIIII